MRCYAVFAHLGLAGGGPITAFPSAPWATTTLFLPFCAVLESLSLLPAASCWPAFGSADWPPGTGTAVIAAVTDAAAAETAVDVGGMGALVGRDGGGAGARRVGGFMWLLGLQGRRDGLCLGWTSEEKRHGERTLQNGCNMA